ncbi:MAG: hypothetical protein OHK93_002010 [Ramalina farinacea]|uniref:Rhodopsin domain-containing protein n=1 Tax=Ramalina farinacea TaxID=258253 RepID=A0AA43QQI8_9LECA|nr:hypothetical protein [Ramalina farinacea]
MAVPMNATGIPPGINLEADQGRRIITANIVLIILPTIFVIGRFASRHIAHAGYWWDDFWVVVALVMSYGPCILVLDSQHNNSFGKHIYVLPENSTRVFLKILYFFEIFYTTAVCAVKVAILCFYRRAFHVDQLKPVLYAFGTVVTLFWIGAFFASVFQCTPISHFWLRHDTPSPGHCTNSDTVQLVIGGFNAAIDFLIIILPLPYLQGLRTPARNRSTLTAIFLTAGFVCIISIIRLIVLSRLSDADVTWNYVDSAIWSAAEPCMGVISACIPSLHPLVKRALGGLKGKKDFRWSVMAGGSAGSMANGLVVLGKKRSMSGASTTADAASGGRDVGDGGFVELEDQSSISPTTTTTAPHSGARGDGKGGTVIGYNVSAWGNNNNSSSKDEEEAAAAAGAAAAARAGVKSLPMMTEVPEGRIRVDSEVEVSWEGGWLEYNDRLY